MAVIFFSSHYFWADSAINIINSRFSGKRLRRKNGDKNSIVNGTVTPDTSEELLF